MSKRCAAIVLLGFATLAHAGEEAPDAVGLYSIETGPRFGWLILLDTQTGRSWVSNNILGAVGDVEARAPATNEAHVHAAMKAAAMLERGDVDGAVRVGLAVNLQPLTHTTWRSV